MMATTKHKMRPTKESPHRVRVVERLCLLRLFVATSDFAKP